MSLTADIWPWCQFREYERRIGQLSQELIDAAAACDQWEQKNGDAPHRIVRLADRIRVNAGLPSPQSEGSTP